MSRTHAILNRRNTGFTLLEMILAIAVTAIVSAALFTSLSGAFKTRRKAEDALSGREAARTALEILRTDIECIPPAGSRISGIFLGENYSGMNRADADALTYVTANPNLKSDQDVADLRGIELRLLESEDDPDHYVLARMVTGNLLTPVTPEPALQVLARRVVSLNIQYYDGGDWIDEWNSIELDNAMPPAVRIELVIAPQLSREPEDEVELEASYIRTVQVVRLTTAAGIASSTTGGINLGF